MTQKKKIIVGNWKMNPAVATVAVATFKKIQKAGLSLKKVQTIICPPYVYLESLSRLAKQKENVVLMGAQDLNPEPIGARTGEISGELLKQFNVSHVIIGHSERRDMGETDAVVNIKLVAAFGWKFRPILCVGEKTRDDDGNYLGFIKNQLEQALAGVKREQLSSLVIAYEPVWAIGSAAAMTPSAVHEMALFIRKALFEIYKTQAISVPILYGGAVDSSNAEAILRQGETSGLLIGRQSLDPVAFSDIITIANAI